MPRNDTFLYVSEEVSERIAVFSLAGETGKLTKLQEVAVPGRVMPMAITPDRRFLFAALRKPKQKETPEAQADAARFPNNIISFAIDPLEGTLIERSTVPAQDSTAYICVDQSGRYLVGACNPPDRSRKTGILTLYPIGPHGGLQRHPLIVRTPPKLHCAIPDPTNRFILAASCNGDAILRFAFDAALGTVSSDGLSPVLTLPKSGPRHLRFHPNGKFLYVVNEYDGTVYTYRYNPANGGLMEVQVVSAIAPPGFDGPNVLAADLHFTPDGRWLYVSARETASLAAFSVDGLSGLLTPVAFYETAKTPRGFGIDPSGRYLISAGLVSSCLVTYRINSETGTLTKLAEVPTGEGPNWIEFVSLP